MSESGAGCQAWRAKSGAWLTGRGRAGSVDVQMPGKKGNRKKGAKHNGQSDASHGVPGLRVAPAAHAPAPAAHAPAPAAHAPAPAPPAPPAPAPAAPAPATGVVAAVRGWCTALCRSYSRVDDDDEPVDAPGHGDVEADSPRAPAPDVSEQKEAAGASRGRGKKKREKQPRRSLEDVLAEAEASRAARQQEAADADAPEQDRGDEKDFDLAQQLQQQEYGAAADGPPGDEDLEDAPLLRRPGQAASASEEKGGDAEEEDDGDAEEDAPTPAAAAAAAGPRRRRRKPAYALSNGIPGRFTPSSTKAAKFTLTKGTKTTYGPPTKPYMIIWGKYKVAGAAPIDAAITVHVNDGGGTISGAQLRRLDAYGDADHAGPPIGYLALASGGEQRPPPNLQAIMDAVDRNWPQRRKYSYP